MKLFHISLSLLVLIPVGAFAQDVTPSMAVPYRDLDLRSEAGVKILDLRLARAVRSVCGKNETNATLARRVAAQRCVREKKAEVATLRDHAIASQSPPDRLASR